MQKQPKFYVCPACEAAFSSSQLTAAAELPKHRFCGQACPGSLSPVKAAG